MSKTIIKQEAIRITNQYMDDFLRAANEKDITISAYLKEIEFEEEAKESFSYNSVEICKLADNIDCALMSPSDERNVVFKELCLNLQKQTKMEFAKYIKREFELTKECIISTKEDIKAIQEILESDEDEIGFHASQLKNHKEDVSCLKAKLLRLKNCYK